MSGLGLGAPAQLKARAMYSNQKSSSTCKRPGTQQEAGKGKTQNTKTSKTQPCNFKRLALSTANLQSLCEASEALSVGQANGEPLAG